MALNGIDLRKKVADTDGTEDLVLGNDGNSEQAHWLIDDLPAFAGDSPFVAALHQIADAIEDLIALFHQQMPTLPGTAANGLPLAPFNLISDSVEDFIAQAVAPLPVEKTPFPFTVGMEDYHGVLM